MPLTPVFFDLVRLQQLLTSQSLFEVRQRRGALFSPSLAYGRHSCAPLPTAKLAAVMILLEPCDNGWTIPLTVRPQHLPDHPGQVSLPGGRMEGNETAEQAARREFCEELGLSEFPGTIVGPLRSLYVYNSDYFVHAFLSICNSPQSYQPCKREVEQLVHLPIHKIMDDDHVTTGEFVRGWARWHARTLHHQGHVVWGATAMILGDLGAVLKAYSTGQCLEQGGENEVRSAPL